jgi:hypothetical protein
MQEYQNIHSEIIEKLQADQRPLVKLSDEQLSHLLQKWTEFLSPQNLPELDKILCILDNTQTVTNIFDPLFEKTLAQITNAEILISTLAAAQKQIIGRQAREGESIPQAFIEALKPLLDNKDPELLEWCLRIIEQLGRQSLGLREDILKRKPGILAIFNKHKVASRQIIELLERRWAPFV